MVVSDQTYSTMMNPNERTSIPTRGRSVLLLLAIFPVMLTSCATKSVETQAVSGGARITASPPAGHRTDVSRIRLVEVNDRSVAGKEAGLRPGRNLVKARLSWPNAGPREVTLRFYARRDQRYFIKCVVNPKKAAWGAASGGYEGSRVAEEILSAADPLLSAGPPFGYLGVSVALGGLAYGMVEGVGRTAHGTMVEVSESFPRGSYMDVLVVSEDPSEGVVDRVRVFRDGRVER